MTIRYTPEIPGGVLMEREWTNAEANFDNIGEAMLTLFASATTEGWVSVMHNGIQPSHHHTKKNSRLSQ